MKEIPVRRLQNEIDLALWDLEVGECPHCVITRFFQHLEVSVRSTRRTGIATSKGPWHLRIAFRIRMLLGLDRGGIKW